MSKERDKLVEDVKLAMWAAGVDYQDIDTVARAAVALVAEAITKTVEGMSVNDAWDQECIAAEIRRRFVEKGEGR